MGHQTSKLIIYKQLYKKKKKKKYYKKVSINKAYKNIHKMSLIMIFSTDEHKRYKVQTC